MADLIVILGDLIADKAEDLIGVIPRRQPWRAVVTALYVLAAGLAAGLSIWLVFTTW